MKHAATLLSASLALGSACILRVDGTRWDDYDYEYELREASSPSPASVAQENRGKLERLQPGMTIEALHAHMGQATYRSGEKAIIANPHRRESYPLTSGARADVFFYYSETFKADGLITEDELTPVWFEDGVLVGWGRSGYEAWSRKRLRAE